MPSLDARQPSVAPARRPASESHDHVVFFCLTNVNHCRPLQVVSSLSDSLCPVCSALRRRASNIFIPRLSHHQRTYLLDHPSPLPRYDASGRNHPTPPSQPKAPAALPAVEPTLFSSQHRGVCAEILSLPGFSSPSGNLSSRQRRTADRGRFEIQPTSRTAHPAVPTLHDDGSEAPHTGAEPAPEGEMANY